MECEYETVRVEKPGEMVGKLVLDRPYRLNLIDDQMLDDLADAIDALEADDDVRAVEVVGAGRRAFSAGADIQNLIADEDDALTAVEMAKKGQETFGKLETCSMPVVAAIDGDCIGGGMELATCADLRVATEGSEFSQPEHDLGLSPGWGGTQRLANVVGEGRAKEIIYTADRFDAETMAEYGFVNEVVPAEEFEDRAFEFTADLAAGPPIAQKHTKRAMFVGRDDTEAGLEVEAQAFGHLLNTDDLERGIEAYSDDDTPKFRGE